METNDSTRVMEIGCLLKKNQVLIEFIAMAAIFYLY